MLGILFLNLFNIIEKGTLKYVYFWLYTFNGIFLLFIIGFPFIYVSHKFI